MSCLPCHARLSFRVALGLLVVAAGMLPVAARAAEPAAKATKALRIASAGHSFHAFMPAILNEMALSAGIDDHKQVTVQRIGGSRVIQHWELPAPRNLVRPALESGEVDVLTLSPIYLPDEGIEKLTRLALEHQPDARVLVQEFWLPFDVYQLDYKDRRPEAPDRDALTIDALRARHAPYFESMDAHIRQLNATLGRDVLFVVPVGQAVLALREKVVAGEAPGVKKQSELFTDAIGHAAPPIQTLVAYCHFAVIYGRNPAGLPVPSKLANWGTAEDRDAMNRLLQQLAWEAVVAHPLSGVTESSR